LAPEHAKRLLRALEDNVEKYEQVFGTIQLNEEQFAQPIASIKGEA
jgi:hypothetical protein